MWSVLLCSFIHIQLFVPHVEPNTKMVVKKCNFIHKVPEKSNFRVVGVFLLLLFFIVALHTSISVQNPWKGRSPQTSLPSPRLKQPQQSLSVSLSSRTQHWDCFVTYCKRYSLHSGQWQHFCSFVGSFCHYVLLTTKFSSPAWTFFFFLHSVYCTPMVSVIPLRQLYQSTSVSNSVFVTITAHVQRASGLSTGAHSLRPAHYASLSDIIANHSGNHQLFADDAQLQKSAPLSEVTSLAKELYACTLAGRHENMDDGKSARTERRQNRIKLFSFTLFVFLETYRFPPWFNYFWLSQLPLLWFCQEPWIHSWLKTVHEEACCKNLPNCLFRAKTH